MKNTGIFLNVSSNITGDYLSDFINSIKLIPNAFGHQENNPGAECGDRITGDFEFIYIVGGESFITVGTEYYTCGAGDVLFIPPFTRHKIKTSRANPHNNYWMHFDVHPFYRHEDFINAISGKSGYRVHIGILPELVDICARMDSERVSNRPGSMVFMDTMALQLITTLLRYTSGRNMHSAAYCKEGIEKGVVDRGMEFVQKNLDKQIRIKDLCSFLNISESYLFKAFQKILKMPPNDFILMCKIKKAEQFMKTTGMSFKEIADTLGFSSPYYFSAVFKRFYGVSPRNYMSSLGY